MKPAVSHEVLNWALRALGAALTALAAMHEWSWQSVFTTVVAAVGGTLAGTSLLGPGQLAEAEVAKTHIPIDSIPPEVLESIRPSTLPK